MENLKIIIQRKKTIEDKATLGGLIVLNEDFETVFNCMTLERAYLDNNKNISAVPKGIYTAVWEYSPKFDTYLWELKEVPNRTEVKFHAANYWHEIQGCIALGEKFVDFDLDGIPEVTNSRRTMDKFHKSLKDYSNNAIEILII